MTTLDGQLRFDPWTRWIGDVAGYTDELLEHAPVYRTEAGEFVISRHADAKGIITDPRTFSSRPQQSVATGFPPRVDPDAPPEELAKLAELTASLPIDAQELQSATIVSGADPPVHTRLRKIVDRGFTPRRSTILEPGIAAAVEDCVRGLSSEPRFDVMERVGVPVPVRVIAEILSIDAGHQHDVKRWSDAITTFVHGDSRGTIGAAIALLEMFKEFAEHFLPKIEARRASPTEDLISDIVRAEEKDSLTPTEAVLFLLVLMGAGNETSTALIGNLVVSLCRHPDQLALIQEEPDLIGRAVEESLRLDPPIQFLLREAEREVEFHGVTIPAGAQVVLPLTAANRDPRVYADPHRFDVTRRVSNLAFGHGIHFCIGAHLARAEAHAVVRAMAPFLHEFEVIEDQLQPAAGVLVHGYETAPLRRR